MDSQIIFAGSYLNNGAMVVMFHKVRENYYIVLAHRDHKVDEFVTWFVNGNGDAEVGVYGNFKQVYQYYMKRVSEAL